MNPTPKNPKRAVASIVVQDEADKIPSVMESIVKDCLKKSKREPKRTGRVMWYSDFSQSCRFKSFAGAHPVLVLPLSDMQALVESRAMALHKAYGYYVSWTAGPEHMRDSLRRQARATLLADGIPAKLLKT